jgi:RNA polymerase sigma-70 factor (ECF subfamily)
MKTQPETQLLIKQLNNGSEKAFDQIYRIFSPRVFSFALSLLQDKQEAEEIVQDVFIKIWNKREELSLSGSFESYLLTISKNIVLNTIRKADYHRGYLKHKQNYPEPAPQLEEEINCRELETIYQKAIEKLSPRKREIFILNQRHSFSYDEIAQKLDISVKTVRNQMDSAYTEIKQLISSLGFTGILILAIFIK